MRVRVCVWLRRHPAATELDAALIVHTREAEEDTLRLMRQHLPRDARVRLRFTPHELRGQRLGPLAHQKVPS